MLQAALGLGPALYGGLFAWRLQASESYPAALGVALGSEVFAMAVLALMALVFGLRRRRVASKVTPRRCEAR
jgi:hypothetical protein